MAAARWIPAVSVLAGCIVVHAAPDALERARDLYNKTDFEAALAVLEKDRLTSAPARLLEGKILFQLGDYKRAVERLEQAAKLDRRSSEAAHWLGKAHGRRAETASFLTAPRYAVECRKAFENAVRLDPANKEAWSDLFEYYLEAPGFLGGGLDKAEAAAKRIEQLDPVERYYAAARLAEKKKDFRAAEQNWRRAAELAPDDLGRVLDVARFLARQGRISESEEMFAKAEAMWPGSPKLWFARAQVYVNGKRNLETARRLLDQYIRSTRLTPDDPPRHEARKLLKAASGG